MRLEVRKAHLNALSLVARFREGFGRHLAPGKIAGVFVQVPRDRAGLGGCAAVCAKRAGIAVRLRSAVAQRVPIMHGAGCPKQLAVWADIDPALFVPDEVPTRENPIFALTLVPHRDMRRDLLLLN